MTKKWLLLIPAGLILSACNSAAPTASNPQAQATPIEVITGAPTPSVKAAMSYTPADLSDQQLDKDMAAIDKELSSLEKDSAGVDASFNDTPIDVNK